MSEKMFFKKYVDLSKNELNTKNNKEGYAKNDVMTTVIKLCRCEKKRRKKNRRIQKKLMIPESELSECQEYEVRSKIGKIF